MRAKRMRRLVRSFTSWVCVEPVRLKMGVFRSATPVAALCITLLMPLLIRADVTFTLAANVTSPVGFYFCTNNNPTAMAYQLTGQFTVPGSFTDLAGLFQQASNLPSSSSASINGTGTVSGTFTDCGATISGTLNATIGFTAFTDDGSVGVVLTWPDANTSLLDLCPAGCPYNGTFEGFDQIEFYDVSATSSSTLSSTVFVEGPTGSLTITPSGGSQLAFPPVQLDPATVGQSYGPVQLVATGGTPPYFWSWSGNMLPAGMQLTSSGVLQGTPQRAASYQLPIVVEDSSSPQQNATATLSLTVNAAATLQFTTGANLPTATLNTVYNQLLAVSGATSTVTYQLTQDSIRSFPPGLSLTDGTETGVYISGTPSATGNYSFTVVATEACTGCTTSRTFNLNVASTCTPLAILYDGIPAVGGTVGLGLIPAAVPYTATFTAQCGTPPYHWDPPSPAGLYDLSFSNCSDGATCTLSGTPYGPAAPSSNVFFQPLKLTDSATPTAGMAKAVVVGEIQIPPKQPLSPAGPITDTATAGQKHLFTGFNAGVNGGRPPDPCSPEGGQILQQAGLSLQQIGSWCALAGIPTAPGSYPFNAEVTDQNNAPPVTVLLNVDVQAAGNSAESVRGRAVAEPRASSAPSINAGGVVDIAASHAMLTPGGIMSLYGVNLADAVHQASSKPLPTTLDNVQVTVNGENSALFYISPDQIDFQAPVDPLAYYPLTTSCLKTPLNPATFMPVHCPAPGPADVMVIRDGIPSAVVSVPVSTSAAAVITLPNLAAIATHLNGQLITQSSPAQAGEVIVIYGAGIGYPTCPLVTGFASPGGCLTNVVPQFTFPDYPSLNAAATLLYAGLTPGSVGLAQFNFQMPASLPSGATAAGSIRMRIGNPSTGQTFNLFLPSTGPPPSSISYTNQRVSTQAPPATGCVVPPAVTSFLTTQNTVYLFFQATTTASDALTDQWIAPGGSVAQSGTWTPSAGNGCYSSSLSITNLPASQLGSWSVQVYNNGTLLFSVPFTVSAPAVTISYTDQRVSTQAPPVTGCVVPPAVTSFLTTQNTVYLFFQATTTASDALSYQWIAPGGSVAQSGTWTPSAGNGCYSSSLSITNLPASQLGSWSVQVYNNGTLLFSVPFTVSAPAVTISYTDQRVSTQAPPVTGCVVPPAVTSFLTTQNTVYLFFEATTTASDALTVQWIAPGGGVAQSGSWVSETGNNCYLDSFTISNLPASQLGSWSVQVYDNGTLLFSVPFTVGAPSVLSATGLNATNGTDNSYEIVADTTGEISAPAAAFVVTSLAGGWGTIPGASWIAPAADQSNATRNGCCANTSDTYQLTLTVSGSASEVALNLTVAADDYVDVLLNGSYVFTHPNTAMWGTPVTFSIGSGFVEGTNTLDFVVTNGGGPTGLIASITSPFAGQARFAPGQLHLVSSH